MRVTEREKIIRIMSRDVICRKILINSLKLLSKIDY